MKKLLLLLLFIPLVSFGQDLTALPFTVENDFKYLNKESFRELIIAAQDKNLEWNNEQIIQYQNQISDVNTFFFIKQMKNDNLNYDEHITIMDVSGKINFSLNEAYAKEVLRRMKEKFASQKKTKIISSDSGLEYLINHPYIYWECLINPGWVDIEKYNKGLIININQKHFLINIVSINKISLGNYIKL